MKKLNSFPLLAIFCSITFLLFTGVECNDDDPIIPPPTDDECGEIVTSEFLYANLNNFALPAYYHIEGDKAVYTFTVTTLEDVCPLKHAEVTIEFAFLNTHDYGLAIVSEVLYGIFYSYKIPYSSWIFTHDNDMGYGNVTVDFGLKPSFGTDPGW